MTSSRVRFAVSLTLALTGAAMAGGCKNATEIIVDVRTDENCAGLHGTAITVGNLSDLAAAAPTSSTLDCNTTSGEIGTLVVVPNGDDNETVGILVVTGVSVAAEQCTAPDYTGCIVARRELPFSPHETLNVVVHMEAVCVNVPCGALDTCVNGNCTSANVGNTSMCASSAGCDEGSLADASAPVDAGSSDAPEDTTMMMTSMDAGIDAPIDSPEDATMMMTPIDAGIDATMIEDAGVDSGIDAGIDSGVDAGVDAPPGVDAACDTTGDPTNEPCLVADTYGIFVSAAASSGTGTRESPVPTITQALILARSASPQKRIYVCDGTALKEQVVIDASENGIRILGGFDCATWTYSASAHSILTGSLPNYVFSISGVTGASIENMEIDGAAGVNNGDSSIGVSVVSSTQIAFTNVVITSAAGKSSTTAAATSSNYTASKSTTGMSTTTATGAGSVSCSCTLTGTGTSTGGGGGTGATLNPSAGTAGTPPLGAGAGGTTGIGCAAGKAGGASSGGTAGAAATIYGTLTSTGWVPSTGTDGLAASIAQGGGGGAGESVVANGGAGGGCGGCGGGPGKGGAGGGSSIAFTSYQSSVSLLNAKLTSAAGGAGGPGGVGQSGQLGGVAGTSAGTACTVAGIGGNGGAGGGGGGGTGGISVALAYSGAAPSQTNVALAAGTAGTGGAGGISTNTGATGFAGMAFTSKSFP